jgi:hypothetical protein
MCLVHEEEKKEYVLYGCYMRKDKSSVLCVPYMRKGKSNMCFVNVTRGGAKVILTCLLHEEEKVICVLFFT